MKTSLIVVALGSLFAAGCVEHEVVYRERPRPAPVVVESAPPSEPAATVAVQAPPPLREEVVVAAPGPNFVWVRGYWEWRGRWVWVDGRWMAPPRPRAVWVEGRWMPRRGHYVWVHGYWR